MSDITIPTDTETKASPTQTVEPNAVAELPKPAKVKGRFEAVQPVLETLFELHPHLFGAKFLPLKLGIFQDLLAAHPEVFQRDALKAALGVHARSTRYLQCVASGLARHDLAGQAVEPVAPEHLFLAIVELFQRRQARHAEDLRPKLLTQLTAAYEQSGLSRQDYLARIGAPSEAVQAVLDDAMDGIDQQRARNAALKKSFEASGKPMQEFADMLGMATADLERALKTP
jgi:sRNA-binding protein